MICIILLRRLVKDLPMASVMEMLAYGQGGVETT